MWSTIILGVSLRVFLDDITIKINKLWLSSLTWVDLTQTVEGLTRTKKLASLSRREFDSR